MNKACYIFCGILLFLSSCKITSDDKKSSDLEAENDSTVLEENLNAEEELVLHETHNVAVQDLDARLKPFVHQDFEAINVTSGDLNLDGVGDFILVLRKKTEAKTSNFSEGKPDKRPMLLLLGQEDKTLKLAYRNDNVIFCIDCGGIFGDPFVGISIGKGTFDIENGIAAGEHWEENVTFRFNQASNKWFLEKDHYVHYEPGGEDSETLRADIDKLETAKDFGTISFEKFNVYSEKGR